MVIIYFIGRVDMDTERKRFEKALYQGIPTIVDNHRGVFLDIDSTIPLLNNILYDEERVVYYIYYGRVDGCMGKTYYFEDRVERDECFYNRNFHRRGTITLVRSGDVWYKKPELSVPIDLKLKEN